MISHDHRFLDNVCTHIVDVDYETITALPRQLHRLRRGQRRTTATARRPRSRSARRRSPTTRRSSTASAPRPPRRGRRRASMKMIEKIVIERAAADARAATRPSSFKQGRPSGRQVAGDRGHLQVLRREAGARGRLARDPARRPRRDHRPQRHRQVDAAQDRHGRGRARRGQRRVGLRDPPRLLRAGPPRAARQGEQRRRSRAGSGTSVPGEPHRLRARQARRGAVLRRRRRRRSSAASPAARRRAWSSARLAVDQAQRAGARRADQPPRPRGDRGPGRRPRELRRHADLRLPRPLVRVRSSPTASSRSRPRGSATSRAPTRSTWSGWATTTSTPTRS